MNLYQVVGTHIRELREARNLYQVDVESKMPPTLAGQLEYMENGSRLFLDYVFDVTQALGITMSEFFDGIEEKVRSR